MLCDGLDQASEQFTQRYSQKAPKGLCAPRVHVRIFEKWEVLLGILLLGTTFGENCQTIRLPLHRCIRPLLGALPLSLMKCIFWLTRGQLEPQIISLDKCKIN